MRSAPPSSPWAQGTWAASSDNVGVTAHDVLIAGRVVAATAGTSVVVTGLQPRTTYRMTVRARDLAGNISAESASLRVTTRKAARR